MRAIITGVVNAELRARYLSLLEWFQREDSETRFQCDCGHEFTATLQQIRNGRQCARCAGTWTPAAPEPKQPSTLSLASLVRSKRKTLRAKGKIVSLPPEVVEQRADKKGVALISEYINCHHPTRFRCHAAGHEFETRPTNIFKGPGCPQCRAKRREKIDAGKGTREAH